MGQNVGASSHLSPASLLARSAFSPGPLGFLCQFSSCCLLSFKDTAFLPSSYTAEVGRGRTGPSGALLQKPLGMQAAGLMAEPRFREHP